MSRPLFTLATLFALIHLVPQTAWTQAVHRSDHQSTGELAYEVHGSGEPILLIHGSYIEDALVPVMNEPSLEGYRLIHYHRRGYAGSEPHEGAFSFEQEAEDALKLLRHLNIDKAHIVGYSLGGVIATQLARSSPEAVQSMVLIEPSLRLPTVSEQGMPPFLVDAIELYENGDVEAAVDSFWQVVSGPDWRSEVEGTLSAAVDQAIRNADVFFELEVKGSSLYPFGTDSAEEIPHPILYVRSPRSSHAERVEFFQTWQSQTEELVVADVDHALPMQEPRVIAEGIARFVSEHPFAEAARAQAAYQSGHFTTSDSVELHYLEAGEGPTIVFVPGWTLPAWIWEPQLEHFATNHRVVALDPRGHGRSEKPSYGYHASRRALDIGELLEHLGGEPAVVAGWSLAVQEVLVLAHEFGTEDIRGVVLVDHPVEIDFTQTGTARFISLQVERDEWTRNFIRAIHRSSHPEEYFEALTRSVLSTPTNAAAIMIANLVLMGPTDLRPLLDSLERPVIYISSANPFFLAQGDMVREGWPEIDVKVIEDAGHALFVDRPDEFNRILDEFLATLPEE